MRRATRRIATTVLIALAGVATSPTVDQSHLLSPAAVHAKQGLVHPAAYHAHLAGLLPPGPFTATRQVAGLLPPGPFSATQQVAGLLPPGPFSATSQLG